MNFRQRHPEKANVVVIDYDLVAIMMPTTLAGAQFGSMILIFFPSFIICIILTLMLGFLDIQSAFKVIELTRKENEMRTLVDKSAAAGSSDLGNGQVVHNAVEMIELP